MTTQSSPKKSSPKKKLIGCLVILVAACLGSVLLYSGARWGYYQGLWGRENPVTRYLWLCDAPAGFEQTLYPDNVEILVPACENLAANAAHCYVSVTSDRHYLALYKVDGYDWIDIETSQTLNTSPSNEGLIACGLSNPSEALSVDNRRVAKSDGIYDVATGSKLIDYGIKQANLGDASQSIYDFYPCAWLPNNQGVILVPSGVPWGLELLIFPGYGETLTHSKYPVPQPVLKFNVPEAYR